MRELGQKFMMERNAHATKSHSFPTKVVRHEMIFLVLCSLFASVAAQATMTPVTWSASGATFPQVLVSGPCCAARCVCQVKQTQHRLNRTTRGVVCALPVDTHAQVRRWAERISVKTNGLIKFNYTAGGSGAGRSDFISGLFPFARLCLCGVRKTDLLRVRQEQRFFFLLRYAIVGDRVHQCNKSAWRFVAYPNNMFVLFFNKRCRVIIVVVVVRRCRPSRRSLSYNTIFIYVAFVFLQWVLSCLCTIWSTRSITR
jgi:hypothetical protein